MQSRSSSDSGATWGSIIDLSDTGTEVFYPQIASSADATTIAVVWDRLVVTTYFVQVVMGTRPKPSPTPTPTPTPTPSPVPTKKTQRSVNAKGKPPARIKNIGITAVTGHDARTNAGQLIRTRVRCLHGPATAGEIRYCSVIRGPQGKVSLRTYGRKVREIVVQRAPATSTYKAYRKRTVFIDGVKQ